MNEDNKSSINMALLLSSALMLCSFAYLIFYYTISIPANIEVFRGIDLELPIPIKLSIMLSNNLRIAAIPFIVIILTMTIIFWVFLRKSKLPVFINSFLAVVFLLLTLSTSYSFTLIEKAIKRADGLNDSSISIKDIGIRNILESALVFSINPEKKTFKKGEDFVLLLKIMNRSEKKQQVNKVFVPGENAVFRVEVKNEEGAKSYLYPKKEKYDFRNPGKDELIWLEPGESTEVKFVIPSNIDSEGKCSVVATLIMYGVFTNKAMFLQKIVFTEFEIGDKREGQNTGEKHTK